VPVVEKTEAVYDTGTTLILGDTAGIEQLYALLTPSGATPAPQYTVGGSIVLYTSTWASSAANQVLHNV
jgi:hypothetical protein